MQAWALLQGSPGLRAGCFALDNPGEALIKELCFASSLRRGVCHCGVNMQSALKLKGILMLSIKERIQNVEMLEEDGAEAIEIVFALIAAIVLGAAILGIAQTIGSNLESTGDEINGKLDDALANAGADDTDSGASE